MKTTIIPTFALSAAVVVASFGCVKNSTYEIRPLEHETKTGSLDATWFERAVWEKGEVVAIELVYCPMMPKTNTVCRTAIIWRKNDSFLVNTAEGTARAPLPDTGNKK